ncbi:MAG: FtsX-like permease family protein [Verrucomicrobiales bacterium]
MTLVSLLVRSLRHYARWHAGLALAVALAAMVIAGSFAVGDSVRATLARQSSDRIGRVQTVVVGGETFFTEALARQIPGGGVPLVMVRGTVGLADGSRRVGGVTVIGVPETFWRLARESAMAAPPAYAFNESLAAALGTPGKTGPGAAVVIRVEKPSPLSKDAPLSGEADQTVTLRATVNSVVSAAAFGDFSLAANQSAPKNVFVPLAVLQEAIQQPGRVNAALTEQADRAAVEATLARLWTLEDAGLSAGKLDAAGQWDISTTRVFLEPAVARALRSLFPEAQGVLTYMVNRITGPGTGVTPYSMATAADALGLAAGEAALSQWTAEDVGATVGDEIGVDYYEVGRGRQLIDRSMRLRVARILPMDAPEVRRDWTPAFPGIMDAPSCRDWRPGVAMDMTAFRDKDEAYWDEYRGTPKFFLPLADGQKVWANRFGNLTALRVPLAAFDSPDALLTRLRATVGSEALGLTVASPAEAARLAVDQSYDLGTLFLAMSFFLIVTALLLVALMFLFNLESRAGQLGLLRAVGLSAARIRWLVVAEAVVVAVVGAALGLWAATIYCPIILRSLAGEWSGAVGGLRFVTEYRAASFGMAGLAAVVLALATVWLMARRLLRWQPKDLLAGLAAGRAETAMTGRRWPLVPMAIGMAVAAAAVAVAAKGSPPAFFGAGSLLMLAGLCGLAALLRHWRTGKTFRLLTHSWQLAWRNTSRKAGRSLAVAGLLAAGVFMISSMDAFQLDARRDPAGRAGGTGGFAYVGEATLPLYESLTTEAGRTAIGLDPEDVEGTTFVQARVREGDEASCLNLQRPQNPRVLGVDPAALASRGSFTFSAGATDWSVIDDWDGSGPVPAVLDVNYVRYTLKMNVGDVLAVGGDREGGSEPVRLRIAGLLAPSILQGSAVISERAFESLFPGTGGYRFLLVDAPPATADAIAQRLTRQLENRGLALVPAAERLNEFNAVQNTYLRIFSALGGFGLILSTAGLGLLLARTVLERRGEFGVLQAVGFQQRSLRRIVIGENAFLLVAGLLIGGAAAVLAVWPISRGASLPIAVLVAILVGGLAFCVVAARFALRGQLVDALRSE